MTLWHSQWQRLNVNATVANSIATRGTDLYSFSCSGKTECGVRFRHMSYAMFRIKTEGRKKFSKVNKFWNAGSNDVTYFFLFTPNYYIQLFILLFLCNKRQLSFCLFFTNQSFKYKAFVCSPYEMTLTKWSVLNKHVQNTKANIWTDYLVKSHFFYNLSPTYM